VHASFFVAHFDTNKKIADCQQLQFKLNSFLPNAIRIDAIFMVDAEMHARFSAVSRTYHYFLTDRKEPFLSGVSAYCHYPLDMERMNEAAGLLLSTSDFTSFSKLHTDVKTNICKVSKAVWLRKNGFLVFEITADRFLRNMVRAVVGTLIDVGRRSMSFDEFKHVIESKNRSAAGASALARGLFLVDITYPEPVNSHFKRPVSFFM
jgi:tRNA pseudouridine38-40 synthase